MKARTAHDVRHLRLCEHCSGLGDGREMLQVPQGLVQAGGANEGLPTAQGLYHGACVAEILACADLLGLPRLERGKLRLNEVGHSVMDQLLDAWSREEAAG